MVLIGSCKSKICYRDDVVGDVPKQQPIQTMPNREIQPQAETYYGTGATSAEMHSNYFVRCSKREVSMFLWHFNYFARCYELRG